jgi:hypothetical protein
MLGSKYQPRYNIWHDKCNLNQVKYMKIRIYYLPNPQKCKGSLNR